MAKKSLFFSVIFLHLNSFNCFSYCNPILPEDSDNIQNIQKTPKEEKNVTIKIIQQNINKKKRVKTKSPDSPIDTGHMIFS